MATQLGSSFTPTVPHGWYGQVSPTRVKAAATSTNATLVKAGAGSLAGAVLCNNAASARYVKFYDKATVPTVGTDTPLFTIVLEPNTGTGLCVINISQGIPFAAGIGFGVTTGVADTDTGQTSADDVHGVLIWS